MCTNSVVRLVVVFWWVGTTWVIKMFLWCWVDEDWLAEWVSGSGVGWGWLHNQTITQLKHIIFFVFLHFIMNLFSWSDCFHDGIASLAETTLLDIIWNLSYPLQYRWVQERDANTEWHWNIYPPRGITPHSQRTTNNEQRTTTNTPTDIFIPKL